MASHHRRAKFRERVLRQPKDHVVAREGYTLLLLGLAVFPKSKICALLHCAVLQVLLPSELFKRVFSLAFNVASEQKYQFYLLHTTMPFATREDQTLRATARNSAYYLLPDLRDLATEFLDTGGGSISDDRSYFSGRAASFRGASTGSNPTGRDYVITRHLLFFVAL